MSKTTANRIPCLITLMAALCCNAAKAESYGPIRVIEQGFLIYMKDGPYAAISAWVKGGPFEGSKMPNPLQQIEEMLGKPESLEILREQEISKRDRLAFVVINYQKGAAFARFQLYQLANGAWVVADMKSNTDPLLVFPQAVMFPRQP
jgi:hypothetical protein